MKEIIRQRLRLIFVIGLLIAYPSSLIPSLACTSVIVSGKVTPDGRPFIFKNRDTPDVDNLVVSVQGRVYRFIAVVGRRDSLNLNVWSGHNEAGFAIANTAAYNLNGKPQPGQPRPNGDEKDGNLMYKALETCRTLADFEHLLDSIKQEKGTLHSNSNFAVLDSEGGVAYYETGNAGYVKYDANDPLVAPNGYLIRTNHGMTGDRTMDQGIERYLAISDYMTRASFENGLDFEPIIRKVTRTLTHGLTRLNLWDFAPQDDSQPVYFPFRDFIPRYLTASAQLIQGVRAGEDPSLTIAWTIPGSTLTTVAIPLWITPTGELPQVVTRNQDGHAILVDAGLELKKQLFPIDRGNGHDYINLSRLVNHAGTGILQRIEPVETEIFRRAQSVIETIRKNNRSGKETKEFYQWVDQYVSEQYRQRF
ncbi:MAG: hypothetical protein IJ067_08690, partial [Prevotella sp.]|nr:hypothetical protein [Prevotella sp.]